MEHVYSATDKQSVWSGGKAPLKASWGKLMMWFFLLSDALTFSAFLVAYGLTRSSWIAYDPEKHGVFAPGEFEFSPEYWPIPEEVFTHIPFFHIYAPLVFVGIMTFILIMSSVTMVLAVEAGHRMDRIAAQKWMLWTIIGGLVFLACQAWEWAIFIQGTDEGMATLTSNPYGPPAFADFFFFITGFHGMHVFSGVIMNIIVFYNVTIGTYDRLGHYEMVEKVGLYWHFVDLVWVFVFTFFYLV